ncbi:UNVERIFIED_CONTAM: hypothetical protein FKN15_027128 [Acipenser sinensis]
MIDDCCSSLPCSPSKRVSPAKRKQHFINQAILNSDLTPKAKGRKSLRRLENTRYLANLLERDECSKDEEEESEQTAPPSIFTEACTNGNYVQVPRVGCGVWGVGCGVRTAFDHSDEMYTDTRWTY